MKVLATTDGTECSTAALRYFGRLLPGKGADLVALSVLDTPFLFRTFDGLVLNQKVLDEVLAIARNDAAEGRKILEGEGLATRDLVLQGDPADVILRTAVQQEVDLVEVSAHGYKGIDRLLLGSVSSKVVQYADRSVIVIRAPRGGAPAGPIRVLATTDGSECSNEALRCLGSYLPPGSCVVLLLTVRPPVPPGPIPFFPLTGAAEAEKLTEAISAKHDEFLVAGAKLLEDQGFEVRTLSAVGDAADTILETAAKESSEVVVVGSHGRSGLSRFLLGSVSSQVVQEARASVLVVRPRPA